jgi:conjugal transfer ATP-binding protein TraC
VIAALDATGNALASTSPSRCGRSRRRHLRPFFQGEVSFELQAQLTVFELSDLSRARNCAASS